MASTTEEQNVTRKRRAAYKRPMSQDVVLPDVINHPDVHPEVKPSRRQPLTQRSISLLSAPDSQFEVNVQSSAVQQQENTQPSHRRLSKSVSMEENQGQPERPAKIAARAKIKAVITPHGRKKKQTFKVPPPPPPPFPCDEPMEIDTPALAIRAFEVHVPEPILDIDDHDECFLCPEYAKDIVAYMQSREKEWKLPPDYLTVNPEITSQMRGVLVDWLIQVQAHEELEEETLQLCVTITDHYLARELVPLPQLQLLGITCLLISAKFVERFPPLVDTLCALTAGTYTGAEVLQMERSVLCVLQFNLGLPLPCFFLHRYLMVHQHDVQVERLANYLIDLSLPSIHFVSVLPSLIAASALYVSRLVWMPEEPQTWSPALVHYSRYTYNDLAHTAVMLAKMLLRAGVSKYQGARKKHADEVIYGATSTDPVLDNHPALIQLAISQSL